MLMLSTPPLAVPAMGHPAGNRAYGLRPQYRAAAPYWEPTHTVPQHWCVSIPAQARYRAFPGHIQGSG